MPQASIYYGPDQLGSVRDAYATSPVFNTPQTYDYDPAGNPLVTPTLGPLTDFRYAGMFYHSDSGLYLTEHRAYDPRTGRWLTRDPMGEMSDPAANLYRYANGNPVSLTDANGLWGVGVVATASAEGGAGAAGASPDASS